MADTLTLVPPTPHLEVAAELRRFADQAEAGEIVRCLVIRIRPDGSFAVSCAGKGSDLQLAGALVFAQHDLVTSNTPA